MGYVSIMELQPLVITKESHPLLFQNKNLGKERHYAHVTTMDAVKVLMDAGWIPRDVIALKPRIDKVKGFQKHRVRFYNPKLAQVNGSYVEILLTNSYDARSSFLLQLGVFRLICANGVVVGDTFSRESVRHVGYSDQKVFDAIQKLLPQTETILSAVDRFSSTQLEDKERKIFGKAILEMRFEEDKGWQIDDNAIDSLYTSRRLDDNKKDLWTTFNRAQENLCRHGFHASKKLEDGSIEKRKVQAIKNTFRADPLNKALWSLAEKMYELKQEA